ncbi:MAG TPA: phosphatase PAP2 family protein [Bacteroidota bacterium]|nr:phosphatase PAP2 family protein [Bacteroidota bacterium]
MRSIGRLCGRAKLHLFLITVVAIQLGKAQDSTASSPPVMPQATNTVDSLQSSAEREYLPEWHSLITNLPEDWVRFWNTAFREENIPLIAGITVSTAALLATDDQTWHAADRWYKSSPTIKNASDILEYMGDGRPQFGLSAAFAAYGFVASDRRALRTGSEVSEAILACGVVIQVLKHITGRESPYLSTRSGGRWDFFPNQIQYAKHVPAYDAYPSGHIATALTTVTVVVENYPEWWWARPLGYTIVGLIGISMGNTGIHWYSDYPLGLALGYSFGMIAAHPREMGGLKSEQASGESKLSIAPRITPEGAGFAIQFAF